METTRTLTGVQAAVELGISEREVRRRAERGELERFREGKKYLYRVKSATADQVDNPIVLRDGLIEARAKVRELQMAVEIERRHRRREGFSLRLMLATAALTAAVLGGVVAIGVGWQKGRGAEMLAVKETLSIERERGDEQRQRIDELTREIIEGLRQPQAARPEADELI